MPRAIVLCGSPRKGGNTDLMADAFTEGARQTGAEVEKVYLDDLWIRPIAEVADVPEMRVDLRQDDDARRLLDRVLAADIVLFAAPVYWQGVPAQIKAFVDRWACYWGQQGFREAMGRKVFAVVTAHASPEAQEGDWVINQVRAWADFLGARFVGSARFGGCEKGAVARSKDVLEQCRELGREASRVTAEV
ncbi:MAG: flavodoxin family protein [Armatimonadota bacterium]